MTEPIKLEPVDCVEITTLYENLVDMTMPGGGAVKRLAPKAGKVVSTLLAEEKGTPFTGGHGLSMLVRVTRNAVTRSLLFDTGGSPDGLVHNLDRLGLDPQDWNCIVLSHGHWDHTSGLIGLNRRLGRLSFPLTLHPDAYLKRVVVAPTGELIRLPPPSRQGLRDAGLELIESEHPSFVVEGMALVTGQVARTNEVETGWPAHHAERNGVLVPDPLICDESGTSHEPQRQGPRGALGLRSRWYCQHGSLRSGHHWHSTGARGSWWLPSGTDIVPRPHRLGRTGVGCTGADHHRAGSLHRISGSLCCLSETTRCVRPELCRYPNYPQRRAIEGYSLAEGALKMVLARNHPDDLPAVASFSLACDAATRRRGAVGDA